MSAAIAGNVAASGVPCPRPACLLSGGETTVTVRGGGKGGRNQELALAFLLEMEKYSTLFADASLLSFSTDGEDGPTDAAGGFAFPSMVGEACAGHLDVADALRQNDSNTLLEKLGGLFTTGPTGTNVCDLQIVLIR